MSKKKEVACIRVRGANKQRKVVNYSYNTGYSRSTAQYVFMPHDASSEAKRQAQLALRRTSPRHATPRAARRTAGAMALVPAWPMKILKTTVQSRNGVD